MPNSSAASDFALLPQKFAAANEKKQLQLLTDIDLKAPGSTDFLKSLLPLNGALPTIAQGKAYQLLYDAHRELIQAEFPQGIVPLESSAGVDYQELQKMLADRQWQAADKLTNLKLCELAGPVTLQRQWLYFTDMQSLPLADLQLIDRLWLIHSEGKFGFSVQHDIWTSVKKDWGRFWPKIGWKEGNNWTRYPGSFTWDITAPRGHLPLSNQLRGVRAMAALLAHPAWDSATSEAPL
jgi:GUN4-like/ARM-like repeat domain, GUN4-N terminal